jgi:hypothetical protein
MRSKELTAFRTDAVHCSDGHAADKKTPDTSFSGPDREHRQFRCNCALLRKKIQNIVFQILLLRYFRSIVFTGHFAENISFAGIYFAICFFAKKSKLRNDRIL